MVQPTTSAVMHQLTGKQDHFLNQVGEGKNIYLTGKAGTGKSTVTTMAIEKLKRAGRKVIVIAPTGIAAMNIDGATIHSTFGIRPFGIIRSIKECNHLRQDKREVLKKADTIIIDEISMLRPDILDAMHWTLRKNGSKGLDSKQLIFVGDLKQLPPVLSTNDKTVLLQTYDGYTFLHSEIIKRLDVVTIELDEILRQKDPEFIEAVNIIRDGGRAPYFHQFYTNEPKGVILAPHNATVAAYNQAGLEAQEGDLLTFDATLQGSAKPEDFTLEHVIKVKNGCKIMYLVNDRENPLRNGTLGVFTSRMVKEQVADDPTAQPVDVLKCFIKINETEFPLNRVTQVKKEYVYNNASDEMELVEKGSITQYPFKLAYALSIHKSQGLTFEELTVDLTRPCFVDNQIYVALSRVRGPEGLLIIPPSKN